MDALLVVGLFAIFGFGWALIARGLRGQGKPGWLSHLIGGVLGFVAFTLVGALLTPEDSEQSAGLAQALVSSGIGLGLALWFFRRRGQPADGHTLSEGELHRLAGLCEGILLDDQVSQREAVFLQGWLNRAAVYRADARSRPVVEAVDDVLADGVLHPEESDELFTVLSEFCDAVLDRETAPVSRATPEPAPEPAPEPKASPTPEPAREKTSTEGAASGQVGGPELGDEFEITYQDAKGQESVREVEYRSVRDKGGRKYLNAYCHSRHAFRTFRVDRIRSAINLRTGEILNEPLAYFA